MKKDSLLLMLPITKERNLKEAHIKYLLIRTQKEEMVDHFLTLNATNATRKVIFSVIV